MHMGSVVSETPWLVGCRAGSAQFMIQDSNFFSIRVGIPLLSSEVTDHPLAQKDVCGCVQTRAACRNTL